MRKISDWDKYNNIVFQIDLSVKKRQSKYIIRCIDCLNERKVCYCQAYNIVKAHNSGRCQSCCEKNKEPRPRKEKYINPNKLKDVLKYRNIFNNPAKSPEVRQKMREQKLGKYGDKANNWRGGTTSERKKQMSRPEYKDLRLRILKRDNYCCQICNSKNKLEMDHIKEWCNYPELRYEPSNLRILCKECHKKTDNYSHKAIRKINGI